MKEKIAKAKQNFKKAYGKAEDIIYRPFDITFALKKKKAPENPVVTLNVKGQMSKKAVVFLTVVGAITTAAIICKIVKALKKIF